ncbi:TRAP transporter small permease [Acuticoccus sp.]|uniref:TRAP transporter small permease n=1 Tax=Acuticoccus sp. TaxID=1904378 RepID=UPI003B51C37E
MRAFGARLLFASAALLLAGMALSLFFQVVAREARLPVDWTEELSRFAFIAMVFLASAYATLRRRHLRVSVFSDLVARWVGPRPVAAFHLVILVAFEAVMVVYSALNFVEGLRFANISPAIGFNQNHLFVVMSVGFAASALINAADLLAVLSGRSDGQLDGGRAGAER